jgi:DNA replication protein DnaC
MQIAALLERLKLDHLAAQLDGVCEQAAKGDLDYKSFLTEALAAEWKGRYQKGVENRLKLARFPWIKTLDQFDFAFQPSIDRKIVRELGGLSFLERAHNVVLLGPPGVGKTHIAVALGVKAVEAGFSVLFVTLETLMGRLVRARRENRLERTLQQLVYPRLLILDSCGVPSYVEFVPRIAGRSGSSGGELHITEADQRDSSHARTEASERHAASPLSSATGLARAMALRFVSRSTAV